MTSDSNNLKKFAFKPFTNAPITWRKRNKTNICKERAQMIVDSFFPETEVGYNAVKMKMITEFGLCSDKTILSYLGRPETSKENTMRQTVKYVKTQTVVGKDHTFRLTLPRVKGYLEIFGLATLFKNDEDGKLWFRLHHDIQEALNFCASPQTRERDSLTGVSGVDSKQVFSFSPNSVPTPEKTPRKTGEGSTKRRE